MEKHFVASAIVYDKGKYLLIKHPELNNWMFPGGHLEPRETPEEAVVREVVEETGYRIKIINNNQFDYFDSFVNTLIVPFAVLEEKIKDKTEHLHIDFIYLSSILSDENIESEKIEKRWVTVEEAAKICDLNNVILLLEKANEIFNSIQH